MRLGFYINEFRILQIVAEISTRLPAANEVFQDYFGRWGGISIRSQLTHETFDILLAGIPDGAGDGKFTRYEGFISLTTLGSGDFEINGSILNPTSRLVRILTRSSLYNGAADYFGFLLIADATPQVIAEYYPSVSADAITPLTTGGESQVSSSIGSEMTFTPAVVDVDITEPIEVETATSMDVDFDISQEIVLQVDNLAVTSG